MAYEPTKNTKTVGQLKQMLSNYPDDTAVLVYIGEAEEYGSCDSASFHPQGTDDDCPYSKADIPQTKKPFVLIEGGLV